MKLALILLLSITVHAQILIKPQDDVPVVTPKLKPTTYDNMIACSLALEKFSAGSGKVSACGFTLDANIIGKPGLFIYTAPDTLYYMESPDDGKFLVELPSGAKANEPHKVYFEMKNKKIAFLGCDISNSEAAGYVVRDPKESTFFDYRSLYRMVLTTRIRSVKSTWDSHTKQITQQSEDRKKEGKPGYLPLKVDGYRDALNACTDLQDLGLIASSELSSLPQKEPVPAKVLTTKIEPAPKGGAKSNSNASNKGKK